MHRFLLPLLCALLTSTARAQVDVSLSVAQSQFLPAEQIEVSVKVSNFTGAPLRFGTHTNWISFTVQRADGTVVGKLAEVADSGEFTLQQATSGTIKFDIAPMFEVNRPDSYRVTAAVTPVQGGPVFVGLPLPFDVISGVRISQDRTFGFTRPDGTSEQRKYILQQANFLKHVRLYVRVTDATESKSYKVTSLGGIVNFTPPQWVIDRQSRLHVLHQFAASEYYYNSFDPEGNLVARRIYKIAARRPELRVNGDGEIAVIGGTRRLDRTDIPEPTDEELAAARRALQPVAPKPAVPVGKDAATTDAPTKKKQR